MDPGLEQLEIFKRLAIALGVGLLIGLERGWSDRDEAEGQRIAGIRTFGLISLLGALWSLIYMSIGNWAVVMAFLGFCGLVIAAAWLRSQKQGSYGITTPVAALITFALGALAVLGQLSVAAGTAVVVALILGLKTRLHGWLLRLDEEELFATLKLLLISVVMLPVLPDQGYGPWQAFNPYDIWRLVVLVAAISYCGYFTIRISGPQRGVLLTAVGGGMVSSTAVTLTLSRLQQKARRQFDPLYATGIILAAATVFPRMLLWVIIIKPGLLQSLLWPLGLMNLGALLIGLLAWRDLRRDSFDGAQEVPFHNPFEIKTALQLGALLAAVMILAQALREWFGNAGIYLLALFSGMADVDAITLTVSRMSGDRIDTGTAVIAITVVAMMNTLVKAVLAGMVGGLELGKYISLRIAVIMAAGAIGLGIAVY